MNAHLRLLKFDSIHPLGALTGKQEESRDHLLSLSYDEYYRWLVNLRMNLSDFLTYYMNEGGWTAKEVIAGDEILLSKLPGVGRLSPASDAKEWLRRLAASSLKDIATLKMFRKDQPARDRRILERYINYYKPEVIFVREPSRVKGRFWDRFSDKCLIVGFTGCTTLDPWDWNAHRYDVIFTLTEEYRDFFKAEGIESHLFSYGVDERLANEVDGSTKRFDCTFVGYLGVPDQRVKTKLMEFIAQHVEFKWWGIKGPEIDSRSALHERWQGPVAGIDMFRIYKESKIVVNEYPEMAMNKNVNMRTMEVLNVGSFLLTRAASNIDWMEKGGALATFNSPEDCLAKVKQFLANDEARERIAAQGQRVALEKFNYRDIAQRTMEIIAAAFEKKRGKLKPWLPS